jgi:hypothetical protein
MNDDASRTSRGSRECSSVDTCEAMPDWPARVAALRRLDGLRITAERQLKMARPGEPNASPPPETSPATARDRVRPP